MLPLLIALPVLAAGGYLAYTKGWLGSPAVKAGGPAKPTSAVDASAAIQQQISILQNQLVLEQSLMTTASQTGDVAGVMPHMMKINDLKIQIAQLQAQLAHAGTL